MSTTTVPYSPMVVIEQGSPPVDYYSRHGSSSVGPVIGVLAVIAVLGGVAVMLGRLCSGRKIMGHGQYDLDTYLEIKFASCIDGHLSTVHHPSVPPPPPPPLRVVVAADAITTSTTSRGSEEVEDDAQAEGKKEEVQEAIQEVENHHETTSSTVVH